MQHPESGKLLVNFDKEIMQLVRETKYMQRFSIPVPEAALMVLLQEEKYKYYYNQMSHLVRLSSAAAACVTCACRLRLPQHEIVR